MTQVEKKVKIKLISTITPVDGETESYELWLQGTFINKSNNMYLRYEEVLEDKQIKTTVRMSENNALILRSGGVNMRLPFNLQQKESGHYDTDFGTLPLLTKTNRLTHVHNEHHLINGTFNIQYELIVGGQSVGEYKLEINYSEGQA